MHLSEELRAEKVAHLDLSAYGQVEVHSTVREAVEEMRKQETNVCLAVDGQQLAGIFTVRDVVRRVVMNPESWEKPISEVMTPEPITIGLDASASDALWLMSEKGIRNVPAVDSNGSVVGNLTHRSIIDYLAGRYPTDILNLPPRPDQFPENPEGG